MCVYGSAPCIDNMSGVCAAEPEGEFRELIPGFQATRGAWNELTKLSHHAEDAELIPTTTVPAPLGVLIMLLCGP